MGWATDTLLKIQAAITARLDGGEVEEYTGPSGISFRTTPLSKLWEMEAEFLLRATAESDTPRSVVSLANLQGRQ
jgi:hypothetical protein